jgi:PTS system beta-glucosides-specific IIC component
MMVVTKSERLKSVMPTQFGPVTKDTKVLDVELQSNSVESVTAVATND